MERSNSIKRRQNATFRSRRVHLWSLGAMFTIWGIIGIALGFVADSLVAVLATVAWSGVVLAFGCWAIDRMFWRAA